LSTAEPLTDLSDALNILVDGTEEQSREVMRQLELAKIMREQEEIENA
jgi:hypothetical protein